MDVLCQDPSLSESVRINVADLATVRDLSQVLMNRLELDSPPALYAYLQPHTAEQLAAVTIVSDDRVDLPDDMLVGEVLRNMRHESLPIYFSTLTVADEKLLRLRTHRFRQVGYDVDRLQSSKVLIGGVGLLGGEIANNLVTLGVGCVQIVDNGFVDWLNLYRQPLFDRESVYMRKVDAAKRRLESMGGVSVTPLVLNVPSWRATFDRQDMIATLSDLDAAIMSVDLVVGTFDSFSARSVLQFGALVRNRPFLVAALEASKGQVNLFRDARTTGCYCCGLPDPGGGRWYDGGGCTLAELETQKVVAAIATKCAVDSLTTADNTYDQISYDPESMTIEKTRRSPSPRCSLCGPEGTVARCAGDTPAAIISWLFADVE